MGLFDKSSADEWLRAEDKELERMIAEIESLPNLQILFGQLNELKTAINVLKKTRKKTLAQNVHSRAQSLRGVFEDLYKKTAHIESESERVEEMERDFSNNFLILNVQNPYGDNLILHFRIGETFILGRGVVPRLPTYVSRKHLELKYDGRVLWLNAIGKFPSYVSFKSGIDMSKPAPLTKLAAYLDQPITIFVKMGEKSLSLGFSFKVSRPA